jgi:hypothetical protein
MIVIVLANTGNKAAELEERIADVVHRRGS